MNSRHRPYSARYKRKRVQEDMERIRELHDDPELVNSSSDTEDLTGNGGVEEDEDFVSCLENGGFNFSVIGEGKNAIFSDGSPLSTEAEDDFSEDDVVINGIPSDDEGGERREEEGLPNFRELFAVWAVTWGINQNAIDALLSIFRLFSWGSNFPRSCRTLLKTENYTTTPISKGPLLISDGYGASNRRYRTTINNGARYDIPIT